jgi:hypothetical protein
VGAGATQASSRLAFTLLFLCGQVVSWVLRDFAKPLIEKLPWVVKAYTGEPPDSWFGEQAVLRVSMGNALFFGSLAAALLGVSSSNDPRVKCVTAKARRAGWRAQCARRVDATQRAVCAVCACPHLTQRGFCDAWDVRARKTVALTRRAPRRRHLHRGSWALKTFAWALLTMLPFLLPNNVIAAYGACACVTSRCTWQRMAGSTAGDHPLRCRADAPRLPRSSLVHGLCAAWVARFASGGFLVVQMIILLDFAYVWNEQWASKDTPAWLAALLTATAGCYAGAFTLLGLAFHWFHPAGAGDCSLNVFLLTLTLLLGLGYSAGALHPAVQHGSLLCSGVIFLYNAYLTVSALSSEPASYTCNGRPSGLGTSAGQAGAAMGMVLALVSVAYSAARAGSSGTFLFSDGDSSDGGDDAGGTGGGSGGGGSYTAPLLDAEAEEGAASGDDDAAAGSEDGGGGMAGLSSRERAARASAPRPLRYNLAAFHTVFALASCYTAMLLTDWASGAGSNGVDQLGVGWTSTWVKVVSSWVTTALYAWSLAAPLVFPERF